MKNRPIWMSCFSSRLREKTLHSGLQFVTRGGDMLVRMKPVIKGSAVRGYYTFEILGFLNFTLSQATLYIFLSVYFVGSQNRYHII